LRSSLMDLVGFDARVVGNAGKFALTAMLPAAAY